MTAVWIILGLIVLAIFLVIIMYNRLVRMRNTVRSSWSDIDVQLKKRFDLVPNLVDTVKQYAKHERELFEKVTRARAEAMQAGGPEETGKKDNIFKDTLKSLFAVAEAYPELKANTNFQRLQNQFQELEDSIEAARRYYNAVVRDYNTMTETFPSVLVANAFRFEPAEFFKLDSPETERKAVRGDWS